MSSSELVARYLAQRSRPRILIPLAIGLAAAGRVLAPGAGDRSGAFVRSAAIAFALVLAFRVWDDLEDRARDAVEHSERLTVVGRRTLPFVALAAALAVTGLAPLLMMPDAVARFVILLFAAAIILAWYRLRPSASASVFGGHVVLIKYPAIAMAVAPRVPLVDAGTATMRAASMLVVVYLALCIYESADDPALRASRTARRIAAAEAGLLVPFIVASVYFSRSA